MPSTTTRLPDPEDYSGRLVRLLPEDMIDPEPEVDPLADPAAFSTAAEYYARKRGEAEAMTAGGTPILDRFAPGKPVLMAPDADVAPDPLARFRQPEPMVPDAPAAAPSGGLAGAVTALGRMLPSRKAEAPAPAPAAPAAAAQEAPPPEIEAWMAANMDQAQQEAFRNASPAQRAFIIQKMQGRPGSPGVRVGAAWTPTTRSVSAPTPIDPETGAQRDDAERNLIEASMKTAEAENALATAEAFEARATAMREGEMLSQQMWRQQQREDEVRRRVAEQDERVKAIESGEIDRGRFWKNMSTGSKILAILGSVAGGLTGNIPMVIAAWGAAQRQDLAHQKEALERKRQGFEMGRLALEDSLREQGTLELAENDLARKQIADTKAQIRAMIDRGVGSEAGRAALEQFRAELEAQDAERRMNQEMATRGTLTSAQQYVPEHVVGGSAGTAGDPFYMPPNAQAARGARADLEQERASRRHRQPCSRISCWIRR